MRAISVAPIRRRPISVASTGHRVTSASGKSEPFSQRLGFYLSLLLVLSAVTLGGRSSGTPLSEALFQILAVWLLVWLALSRRTAAESRLSTAAIVLILATLAVAFLQLVPLPYSLWAATSGAPEAATILERIGEAGGARPLTLDASATRETILTLLPPIALFLAMFEMRAGERQRLALVVMVAAAASLVVGLLQFASQTDSLYLYQTTHEGYSVGFFTNRNHQADFTLIGALLASAVYRVNREALAKSPLVPALIGAIVVAFVVVNLVATASRTGIALSIPALVACGVIALGFRKGGRSLGIAALVAGAIGAVLIFVRPDLFSYVLGRFDDAESDLRFQIWPVIMDLIGQYMPLGSGLGTFVPIFQTAEELDTVKDRYVNHAHNDYLEIALEMGAIGIFLVICFMALFAWAVAAAFRNELPRKYAPLCAAAAAGIVVLLAHSVVDYSLRTSSLAITFALLMGLLMPLPATGARRPERMPRQ